MALTSVLNQMIILFVCIVAGAVACRAGVMTHEGNKHISNLVINVTCPAMILSAALSEETPRLAPALMGELLALSVGCYATLALLAWVLPKLLRVPRDYRGLFRFTMVFSNVKFMGFPVVEALLGQEGLFYAAVFNIPFYILVFSLGVWFISGGSDKGQLSWRLLLSPAIVASVAALAVNLSGLRLPAVVGESLQFIGDITSPASMLVLGASIGGLSLRALAGSWRVNLLLVLRQFLIPAAGFFLLRPILSEPVVLGMTVLMLAMPIGSITSMFCIQYCADEAQGSRAVFLSTLISIVAIPILVWLLPIQGAGL